MRNTKNPKNSVRTRKNPHYLKGTLFCAALTQSILPPLRLKQRLRSFNEDVQMSKGVADKLSARFDEELISKQSTNAMEKQFLAKRIGKLADEQIKLLKAYYAEAIPLNLLKKEQDRIATETAVSQNRLEIIDMQLDEQKRNS